MNFVFLNTTAFYLLAPVLLVIIYVLSKRWSLAKRRRLLVKAVLQFLILTLLVCALAQPTISKPSAVQGSLILLDCSDSIDPDSRQAVLRDLTSSLDALALPEVIAFASSYSSSNVIATQALRTGLCSNLHDTKKTNLEAVLAIAQSKGAGQIILLSDGNQNSGRVEDLFEGGKSLLTPVHTVTLQTRVPKTAKINSFYVPQSAQLGQEINAEISFVYPQNWQDLVVRVYQNDELIHDKRLTNLQEKTLAFKTQALAEELAQFRVELTSVADGSLLDKKIAYVAVSKSDQVLILSGNSSEAEVFEKVFLNLGKSFNHKRLDREPLKATKLETYGMVILNNVSQQQLPTDFLTLLKDYVSVGGKFLMLGGNQSFGLGGYQGTLMEDLLPVVLVDPQKELKRLNVAVQLVLDKSGSMKEDSRIEFTKLAAEGVMNALQDGDYLGIVGFDSQPFVVLPISKIEAVRLKAKERIQLLFPRGNTQLLPALDVANNEMGRVSAGRKHVVVLTDGRLPDEYQMRDVYMQLVRRMNLLGITLSTFLIGPDYSPLLKDLAALGGGAFYQSRGAEALPRLFLDDLKVAVGERTQRENARFPVDTGSAAAKFADLMRYPDLLGLVETKIKPGAQLHLTAYDGEKTLPLLASSKYKQGLTLAFTSDASGRWNRNWQSWDRYYDFWTLMLAGRFGEEGQASSDSDFYLIPRRQGKALELELNIFSEQLSNNFSAKIVNPKLETETLIFSEIAKGRHRAVMPNVQTGSYAFSLLNNQGKEVGSRVFALLDGDVTEDAFSYVNQELLDLISRSSGGKSNPLMKDFKSDSQVTEQKESVALYFIIAALLILLLNRFFAIRWRLF